VAEGPRDGRILGANLIGDTSAASAVREVVESGAAIAEHSELLTWFPELAKG
jgi:NAD(P)H-nitrite reductase large subunit